MREPYLSIVVASRNDDHDGALIKRMQISMNVLLTLLARYDVSSELIIVEWNPPKDKARLKKVLSFAAKGPNTLIRIVTVPESVHRKFPNSDRLPLFQFIAKNVGIRRAKGKFIVATNIDVLFSNTLVEFLSKLSLSKNVVLRAVRFDVPKKLGDITTAERIIHNCELHKLRAFWPWGTEELYANRMNLVSKYITRLRLKLYNGIFTNACGDFTLMYKNNWFKLRGYPEFPLHGVKIDSLLLHSAISYGFSQQILPEHLCVYHIDHPHSWTSEKSEGLLEYYRAKGIPTIERKEYLWLVKKMQSEKYTLRLNDDHWGLAKEKLTEFKMLG